jgi:hypothetical protein
MWAYEFVLISVCGSIQKFPDLPVLSANLLGSFSVFRAKPVLCGVTYRAMCHIGSWLNLWLFIYVQMQCMLIWLTMIYSLSDLTMVESFVELHFTDLTVTWDFFSRSHRIHVHNCISLFRILVEWFKTKRVKYRHPKDTTKLNFIVPWMMQKWTFLLCHLNRYR